MPINDKQIEIEYDHYKDTCSKIDNSCKTRDKLFLYILLALSLVCLGLFSYSEAENILSQLLISKLGLVSAIDLSFIGSLIWFGLLVLVIRYFQTVAMIERYYPYVHTLEHRLNDYYGKDVITRESKTYLSNYPAFSNWTHCLYTTAFPVLLLAIITLKIVNELTYQWPIPSSTIFNTFIFISLIISIFLYLRLIYYKK